MQDDISSPADASSAASLSDKKRNKLGYHRTSVACVHCRRRKIRCLVDQNDQQGRCQNCIRLKKDCNFFPVDQQPSHDRQRPAGPKSSSQPSTSPAPSSHGPGDSYSFGSPLGFAPPPPPGMPGHPTQIAPINTQDFNNTQIYVDSPFSAPGQMSDTGTPGYWPSFAGGAESARSIQFPNQFSPTRQVTWAAGNTMSQTHPAQSMNAIGTAPLAPQQRSLSLQHEPHVGYGAIPLGSGGYFDTRAGPPSLHTSTGSPTTTASLSDANAGSIPNQTALHYGIPQPWDSSKEFSDHASNMSGPWYNNAVPSMPD